MSRHRADFRYHRRSVQHGTIQSVLLTCHQCRPLSAPGIFRVPRCMTGIPRCVRSRSRVGFFLTRALSKLTGISYNISFEQPCSILVIEPRLAEAFRRTLRSSQRPRWRRPRVRLVVRVLLRTAGKASPLTPVRSLAHLLVSHSTENAFFLLQCTKSLTHRIVRHYLDVPLPPDWQEPRLPGSAQM